MNDLPPIAKSLLMTIGRIGYRSVAAGISTALKGLGEISTEIDARIKRGERAAQKMANGEPYRSEEDE
jgi:hypothetical protein